MPVLGAGSVAGYREWRHDSLPAELDFFPSSPEGRILALFRNDPDLRDEVAPEIRQHTSLTQEDLLKPGTQFAAFNEWTSEASRNVVHLPAHPIELDCVAVVEDVPPDQPGVLVRPLVMERILNC